MNGAGGRASGWAGLSGGSCWGVESSPVATPAFSPGRGLVSLPSGDGGSGGLDQGAQNAPRGESGSSGRGEEESVGKGARERRMNVRAC